MDKFLKRKQPVNTKETGNLDNTESCTKKSHVEINLKDLPRDPGKRIKISDYHPNDRDEIRRAYLQKGPCQPREHNFPQRKFGKLLRRFNPAWFDKHGSWLEYSIEKDAVFCLCCYLFRQDNREQPNSDSFVSGGFQNWKKKERLDIHVGGTSSAHNQAWRNCQALMNQKQNILVSLARQSDQARKDYRICLTATLDCIRYLLCQGLAFRGHDESEDSNNQGNFLTLLRFLSDHNETINNVVLDNSPGNLKMIAPDIQKDLVWSATTETTNAIIKDLGDELFAILVDESRDILIKEQMAIALRYVDKNGCVIEHFLGIVHVKETTALALKEAIESLFAKHGLSMSRIRGQGYDGASNMQGEFNGLKSLIIKENQSAFYVHCFAHQLQLTLVAVAKGHNHIALFFNMISNIVNVVGVSCKRRDILREKQANKVTEALNNGEIECGRGLHQETSLQRASDTRWGSHYGTLMNLIIMFSSVIDVLDFIEEDGINPDQRGEATNLLGLMQSFEFVFSLHLMRNILSITNELSQALQRKDQDIVNAMTLVKVSKQRLQKMREEGWEILLGEVSLFCEKNNITILSMNDEFIIPGRPRRNAHQKTNDHHYRVGLFYTVIDMQLQELNNRFTVINTELLLCVACLNPVNSFSDFDKEKLIRLAQLYPNDFSTVELMALDSQLETYIFDMCSSNEFANVKGIGGLAEKLVKTKKDIVYPLVYRLLKLALILPVATATVEKVFLAMKIVKNRLRNRMGDNWMNDCLVTYIEKDVFSDIKNEIILQRFQNMKTRREQLSKL